MIVQGSGPVWLADTALVAREEPAQLIVIGAPSTRLEWARSLGATATIDVTETTEEERLSLVQGPTDGRGTDLVLEATGVPESFPEGLALLARRNQQQTTDDPGAFGGLPSHREQAVDLVPELERRFGISALVEETFPLAETARAIQLLRSGGATKTAVIP